VQDLWKHEPVQVSGDTYTATVPKHGVVLLRVSIASGGGGAFQASQPRPAAAAPLTAEQDHQRLMDLLHITSLRPGQSEGAAGPNGVNFDESKANPYPKLPDRWC